MYDDYHPRSPQRGRDQREVDHQDDRERDYTRRPRSRQGYSRSPDSGRYGRGRPRNDMVYARGARPLKDKHDYTDFYDEPSHDDDQREWRDDDGHGRSRARSEYDEEGEYHDEYRSPPKRSRSRSPTRDAGRPTHTVILEGLPYDVDANELQESIFRDSIAADFPPEAVDVRVTSSRNHRRAFVQFASVDYAMDFVKEHYPKLHLELSHPADGMPDGRFSAYVHYARDRNEDHRPSGGKNWNCPSCDFSNYSTRNVCKICGVAQPTSTDWQHSLTGLADAANVPSQILVVYPLASFVNEDMLAQDMKRLELEKPQPTKDTSSGGPKLKSTAPTGNPTGYGARPGSLHRVFLMRDAMSNESFKYGFAEFWTLEDAAAAMSKFNAARSFTVAAVAVNISTIHMGVFLPEAEGMAPETDYMSFSPLFNPSLRVRYRDPRLYPSQQIVTTEPPGGTKEKSPAKEENDAKTSKKRKAEGSAGTAATKKPAVMAGQMAMWQRKADELRGQKGTSNAAATPDHASKTDSDGPIKISLSGAKIGGPSPPADTKRTSSPEKHAIADTAEPAPVSYVDRDRLMCLICMRKYKSVDEVNIHEKSRNHKNSTENEELVKAALPRLAARDKRQQKATPESESEQQQQDAPPTDEPQYRDRAKERRQIYSQPKKAPHVSSSSKPQQHHQPTPQPPPAKPKGSKGAGMLAKFGWKTGEGLGADGQGRTEVIAQNAYQEGAGLGAEGANLGDAAQIAERKTKGGYAEYVSSVQDRARERYNRMG